MSVSKKALVSKLVSKKTQEESIISRYVTLSKLLTLCVPQFLLL